MIKLDFIQPSDENCFGLIKVEIYDEKSSFIFQVINSISNDIVWESELNSGCWSTYCEPCNTYAIIKDKYSGHIVKKWTWDTFLHGDESHKQFINWALINKESIGIAIGTHDGTTGEWVYPLKCGLIDAYLVEASDLQYNKLVNNYSNIKDRLIKRLITTDGGDCEFFEGGSGFTNSILKNHTISYCGEENTKSKLFNSTSLNDLIIELGLEKDLKWLHLDVEGLDSDLILSLDDSKVILPEFIIYESLNLSEEQKIKTIDWLSTKGYMCVESGWNTIARKSAISLLVHTCDEYEEFWSGMLYTLESYWDFNIPVYFASEEKKISDIKFMCKGYEFKSDKRIKQILTGKTDRSGFSNRFIKAFEKIPTKYIIYIQEDMWLTRKLDKDLIDELVRFMDNNNVDSIKIHTRLFYWDSYMLEPTEFFIKNLRLLKQINNEGSSILSHGATIWRKDYLVSHQLEGEDPWTNEVEGSKRMLDGNHYMYNIHWHCQPGVAVNGMMSDEQINALHVTYEMLTMKLKYKL